MDNPSLCCSRIWFSWNILMPASTVTCCLDLSIDRTSRYLRNPKKSDFSCNGTYLSKLTKMELFVHAIGENECPDPTTFIWKKSSRSNWGEAGEHLFIGIIGDSNGLNELFFIFNDDKLLGFASIISSPIPWNIRSFNLSYLHTSPSL